MQIVSDEFISSCVLYETNTHDMSHTPVDDDPAQTPQVPQATPAERPALKITPTDETLTLETVHTQFTTLHRLAQQTETTCVEWLLVKPDATADLEYYLSITDEAVLDRLRQFARTLFPDAYELTATTLALPTTTPQSQPTDADDRIGDADTPTLSVAGIEFHGHAERRHDWQLKLTDYADFESDHRRTRNPLATVVDAMAAAPVPMVYQVLVRPKPDWTAEAALRRDDLLAYEDTFIQRWFGSVDDRPIRERSVDELDHSHAERIAQLDAKDTRRSFDVNVRAVAIGSDDDEQPPHDAIATLEAAFSDVGTTYYTVRPHVVTGDPAHTLSEHITAQTFRSGPRGSRRLTHCLPITANHSPCLVVDPASLPSFCLVDGARLTTAGTRALDITHGEESSVPRPPLERLATYRTPGLTLGRPQTADRASETAPVALPPSLQPLHIAWFGKTGSGKSTSLLNAMLDNHAATDGVDILIDPKGGDLPIDYLRAHYARYGSLRNVYYFDCAKTLPAISFFDIREQLADGIDRTAAVEDVVDHYLDILRQVMGRERFDRAVRSPDIIRYLVKALFDPVNGHDAFGHDDLEEAAAQMHDSRDAPPVSDDGLDRMLGGITTNSKRSFDELMQGVANRIEKIPADERLGHLFNHVTVDAETDDSTHPQFDFRTIIDEDAVVIFDLGALRPEAQRVITLVLLSQLWTALKRRHRVGDDEAYPLVNLFVEEASSVAVSSLLSDLLARGREFSLAVTLAMQFPAQLQAADVGAYAELLNNVSTIVSGNVAVDERFERRFATADMDPPEVGNRLRALQRGQWLVSLPAPFAQPEPRPFVLSSQPLPPGHPEGPMPFSMREEQRVAAAIERVQSRTQSQCGLPLTHSHEPEPVPQETGSQPPHESTQSATDQSETTTTTHTSPIQSALPLTKRLPLVVDYDEAKHALICTGCRNRYAPTFEGMCDAIECCFSFDRVDRDDIPIHALNLTLSAEERTESGYSDRQLAFLQAVYNAHQGRYDEREYNLITDSMVRLREYVGIEPADVQTLVEDGVLRHDGNHPHRLYTVSAAGRELIREGYRQGISHGDGKGDLSESSQHILMVEIGRQYLEHAFVDAEDSSVIEAVTYHPTPDGGRLDAAGLDAQGDIVVALEAERVNNDAKTGVPDDYDKMAACEPEEAIWLTMNRAEAHTVLQALNTPAEGPPRVEKTYSESSQPRRFSIDTPGCTAIYTLLYVRDMLLED
ncbi:hypothetical protein SAMN04487948_10150 [Halogranum amylolyticum]|uniref:AAA-like domain-containing protein n=2 Tax=Halogranum amylolyticum TaxID=660520 RepID=A0A1H8MS28_9EURY|nr:hypothetical protein SAMN04487948_10150 [Halogranum amylolyticum]